MRLSQAWIVVRKDFATFRRKRNIIYSILVIPTIITILFPLIIRYTLSRGSMTPVGLAILLPAFTFFYLILAGLIPTTMASYSLVGEKVEKSLEPLLATPTTDGEILLGKGLAAFIPGTIAILTASAFFMLLMDLVTYGTLGYYFFPNLNAGIVLFVMVPLAAVMSVEWNVFVSSRVTDVRIAQQVGSLLLLPFGGVYVAGELNLVDLGATGNLLLICAGIAVMDLFMLFVTRETFQREEILTRWR